MRKWIVVALAAMFVAGFATSVMALSWTKIGTSTAAMGDPSWVQDYKRIIPSSIVVDQQGNVFIASNKSETESCITIFRKSGSSYTKEELDLTALGFGGVVTKLVVGGGDYAVGGGRVYALQNYCQIAWAFDTVGQESRILQVDVETTPALVTKIWCADPNNDGTCDIDGVKYKIGGMTVGGDGNIYWTSSGIDYWSKFHYFWRYDWATSTVEESPINTTNNGWSATTRMFDLEYVGDDYFAVVNYTAGGSTYRVDPMTWNSNRAYGLACAPGWGREHVTAMAADNARHTLWIGGNGAGSGPWSWVKGNTGEFTIQDVNGNKVYQFYKVDGNNYYYRYSLDKNFYNDKQTLGTSFRVVSADPNYNGSFIQLSPTGVWTPEAMFQANGAGRFIASTHGTQVADLGPVDNNWHTAYIATDLSDRDGSNRARVKFWWDGTLVYDGYSTSGRDHTGGGFACFGNGCRDGAIYAGTSTVQFDWVSLNKTEISGPPNAQYTNNPGCFLGGELFPDFYYSTNIMTRATGGPVFSGCDAWHTNGNEVNREAESAANHGYYWVNTIAVNPANGDAWMAWGAQSTYDYDTIGEIKVKSAANPNDPSTISSAGVPEPNAQVVGIMFDASNNPYVATVSLVDGKYSAYVGGPDKYDVSQIKANGQAGDWVETNSYKVVTYAKDSGGQKVIYIQEQDITAGNEPYSGIKVVLAGTQTLPTVGQKVIVRGNLAVVDGEAQIGGAIIMSSTSGGTPEALATTIKSIGGNQLGVQPATTPAYGLNNIGMLMSITGVVKAIVTSDYEQTTKWFTVDDGSGATTKYRKSIPPFTVTEVAGIKCNIANPTTIAVGDKVKVTGIASMFAADLDGNGTDDIIQRQILPRTTADIVEY